MTQQEKKTLVLRSAQAKKTEDLTPTFSERCSKATGLAVAECQAIIANVIDSRKAPIARKSMSVYEALTTEGHGWGADMTSPEQDATC